MTPIAKEIMEMLLASDFDSVLPLRGEEYNVLLSAENEDCAVYIDVKAHGVVDISVEWFEISPKFVSVILAMLAETKTSPNTSTNVC